MLPRDCLDPGCIPKAWVSVHWLPLQIRSTGSACLKARRVTDGNSERARIRPAPSQAFASTLSGDASLNRRPMKRIADPLQAMGANITLQETGTAPLEIRPSTGLQGIDYVLPVASAQVKSCLLLAGLYAQGRTCVSEPVRCRDHTEKMLRPSSYPRTQDRQVCLSVAAPCRHRDHIPGICPRQPFLSLAP